MSLISQAVLNGQTGNLYQHTNNKKMNTKRDDVFNIISSNKSIIKRTDKPFSIRKPNDYLSTGLNKPYSETELKYKVGRLENSLKDGWVYYFDTETVGSPSDVFEEKLKSLKLAGKDADDQINYLRKLNKDNHIMTEMFMRKQYYKNGKAYGDAKEVFKFTNAIGAGTEPSEMMEFVSKINRNVGGGLFKFNLERFAGLGGPGAYNSAIRKNFPLMFDSNANIDDKNLVYRGVKNVFNNSDFKKGTKEFNAQAQKVYDTLVGISNEKNSTIVSLNGDKFDMSVLFEYFDQAGIKRNKKTDAAIKNSHLDEQKAIAQTSKDVIYKDIENRRKQLKNEFQTAYKEGRIQDGSAIEDEYNAIIKNDLRITNESIGYAAASHGVDMKSTQFHNSEADTIFSQKALETYHQTIIDKVNNSKESINNYDDTLFTANSAVMFNKDTDVFFSNTVGQDGNTYNPVGMESGHTYKFNMYDIEDFKVPDGTTLEDEKRLAKETKKLSGKKLLEMEDQYEYPDGTKRRSYLLLNNEKEMQEKIMNAGNVDYGKASAYSKDEIVKTTEQALTDRARREKSAWYSVNSNKGYSSFERYFKSMTNFKNEFGDEATKENFLKIINSGDKERIESLFPDLHTNGDSSSRKIIQERVMDFYNMFDDLGQNYGMYNTINNVVNDTVGSIDDFSTRTGLSAKSNSAKEQYHQAKTIALYKAKENVDNELVSHVSDIEAMRMFYNNNLDIQSNAVLTKALESGEDSDIVMAKEFKNIFGFDFSKDLDVVRESILGFKPVKENARTANQIDIISPVDGSYTRVMSDNKKNLEESITSKLNGIKVNNGDADARMIARNNYINNMSADLMVRGLISKDELIALRESNNPYSKATRVSDILFDKRETAESIIKKISTSPESTFGEIVSQGLFDYNNPNASSDETRFLKGYLEQIHKSKIMSNGPIEKIGTKTKGELVKNVIKSNEAINKLKSGIDDLIPNIFSTSSSLSKGQSDKLRSTLSREYGWSNHNIDLFFKSTILNDANNAVEGGVSNMIFNINKQGYLITTNTKRQKRLMDYLVKNSDNVDIDEVKKQAMVYKLDKVERINGVKAIKQSDASAIAITNDVVAVPKFGEPMAFELRDTLDESLYKLKNKYKYGLEALDSGNIEKANTTINSSRRNIIDNKNLNGVVVTNVGTDKAGNIIKGKRIKSSIADYMLGEKYNVSELMGSMDVVLRNNDLAESLESYTYKGKAQNLIDKIKDYQHNPYDKSKKVLFENQDVGTKLWFAMNSDKIADELIKSDTIEDDGLLTMLNKIKENGIGVFYSKESSEASKGFINAIPAHKYVAGSYYSGASRPLLNQVLSSKAVVEQDVVDAAKKYGISGGDIFGISENLDFKLSRSFITKEAYGVEKMARLNGDILSMSTKMKYMDPKEFVERVADINNDKNGIASGLAEQLGASIDDIKKAASDIGASTSIYEDSGAISPKLARLFEDKTVTVEKDIDNIANYKIGGEYNGKKIIGIDEVNNSLTIKNNTKYFDLKLAIGGSEKMEVHTPQIDDSLIDLYDTVFKKISDGANIIGNPNYGKHEAFNSMITMYTNAMTRSINSDKDMNAANKILKKNFSVNGTVMHDYKIIKDKINGYTLVEGSKRGNFNAFKAFENTINDLKSNNPVFADMVKSIEKNKIGYVDIATMSDNTIEKSFRWVEKDGRLVREGGAKINHRSQQVLGLFIGNDSMDEITKYRNLENGDVVNPLQSLIDSDIKEMMSDDSYVKKMQQASNVSVALSKNSNIEDDILKKARIENVSIKDVAVSSSTMSGQEVPEIFKFSRRDGQRVNAYKVDFDGLKLANPEMENFFEKKDGAFIYEDFLKKHGIDINDADVRKKIASKFNIKNEIESVYVPALLPHSVENGYVLSETQKSASDLLSIVRKLNSDNYGNDSREKLLEKANNAMANYFDSLRYDLADKNGLFKQGLSIRAENSARLKVANVIAPIVDKDGRYINELIRDKATAMMPDGSVKYVGTQLVNPETLFGTAENIHSSYENIGHQILNNEIGNADELASFLKNNEALKDDAASLGKKYLEDVGIESLLMRDPAMLTTSYQPVKTYIRDSVAAGSTVVDAVTAAWINADGDGDEINTFNHILKRQKDGIGYKILDRNSGIYKSLDSAIEINSKANSNKLQELASSVNSKIEELQKGITDKTISGYLGKLKDLRPEMFTEKAQDYITGDTAVNNFLSRFLKESIGQVSNPNYYLKSASTFYHGQLGLNAESLRSQRNVQLLTDITEQSLIDIKSVKGLEQAKSISKLASSYRVNMDILGSKTKGVTENKIKSMSEMIYQVGEMLEKNGGNIPGTDTHLIKFDTNLLKDDTARAEAAKIILNGKYKRGINGNLDGISYEEIFGDMYKVLQDDNAHDIFWSSAIRQTNISRYDGEPTPDLIKSKRAVSSTGIGNDIPIRNKIFESSGADNYLLNAPMIGEKILNVGDQISSSDVDGLVSAGRYTVHSVSRNDGEAVIQLKDLTGLVDNDKPLITTLKGTNFDDISRDISNFSIVDNKTKSEKNIWAKLESDIKNNYINKATGSITGLEEVFNADDPTSLVSSKIVKNVKEQLDYDNTLDFLTTVEVLKQNKLIDDDELTIMRKNMNEAIKKDGSSTYREKRKEEILKLKKISTERKVSSGTFEAFNKTMFNDEVMKSTAENYKYNAAKDILENNRRYNVDSIANIINNDLNNIIESSPELISNRPKEYSRIIDTFKINDKSSFHNIKKMIENNSQDSKFIKSIMNIDLESGLKAVENGNSQNAINMLSKTIISFGEYTGYSIEQLGMEKTQRILSESYLTGMKNNVNNDIIEETRNIVNKIKDLQGDDNIIKVKPSDIAIDDITREFGEDYLTDIRKNLNENIKEKASSKIRETIDEKTSSIKSVLDKAKTGFNQLSGTKKAAIAAGATAVSALGLMALSSSGNKTLYEEDNKYKKDGNINNVKTNENGTVNTRHQEVPKSNNRFYATQNVGLGVKVKADAPAGATASHSGNYLSAMFGGSDLNISTSFNDSTTPVNDNDIDEMMSDSTTY